MASLTFTDYGQAASKAFMGDFENREHILPGGAQLAASGSWSGLTNNIVPAGTVVGRTTAEKLAGADFGPAADADNEFFIVADETDVSAGGDRGTNLVRHGSVIKYEFLPGWADLSAAVKTALHANYVLVAS